MINRDLAYHRKQPLKLFATRLGSRSRFTLSHSLDMSIKFALMRSFTLSLTAGTLFCFARFFFETLLTLTLDQQNIFTPQSLSLR